MTAARRIIDFREFTGAVMSSFEFAGSGERLHLRFFDDEALDLIGYSSGGGAKQGGAPR